MSLLSRASSEACDPYADEDLPADFFAAGFLAGAFFAGAFFAGALRFFGPCARLSASSSIARSGVIDSGVGSRGSVRVVSPAVTYAPHLPSLATKGLSLLW